MYLGAAISAKEIILLYALEIGFIEISLIGMDQKEFFTIIIPL